MSVVALDQKVYLSAYLAPLQPFLARADVTDIYINRPGEVWVETLGGIIENHYVAALDEAVLGRLAQQVAALAHQGINREHPLLSASLRDGARVQIIAPPATRGPFALAIRKHVSRDLKLDDYDADRAFETIVVASGQASASLELQMKALREDGAFSKLLRLAVHHRRNILIAGGTSTGKTTFLNALIREIPLEERLILIEDTPELNLEHPNAVGLIAVRSALGETTLTAEDLLNASLRLRPDRIILGELRGPEAFTFLRAVNTGHPGSMTTIHADSPERAIEQIALLVLQTGTRLDRESIVHYVRSTIDVFVQLGREGGRRIVTDVALKGSI